VRRAPVISVAVKDDCKHTVMKEIEHDCEEGGAKASKNVHRKSG
jgi:hypothetical protein